MQWENTRIASVLGKLLQGLLRMKQLSTIGDIVAVMEVEMLNKYQPHDSLGDHCYGQLLRKFMQAVS